MIEFTIEIDKVIEETPRVKSFYFKYPLEARPGQYVLVTIPGHGERPFGAVVVDDETFLISVGEVGEGTKKLHTMKAGEKLTMKGPRGTFFTLPGIQENVNPNIALIAGGYGLAPLSFLARVAAELGYNVIIFVGARSKNEFIQYPFLNKPNIAFVKTTDDGSAGEKGFVTDAFRKAASQNLFTMAYIVGPLPMEEIAIDICEENGIPYQVSMEQFAYEPFGPVVDAATLHAHQ